MQKTVTQETPVGETTPSATSTGAERTFTVEAPDASIVEAGPSCNRDESLRKSICGKEGKKCPRRKTPSVHSRPSSSGVRGGSLASEVFEFDIQPPKTSPGLLMIKSFLIVAIGWVAATIVIVIGLRLAESRSDEAFFKSSSHILDDFREQLNSMEVVALWIQQSFRSGNATRQDMIDVVHYLNAAEVAFSFDTVAYVPKVAHEDRGRYEDETRQYLVQSNQPGFLSTYPGFHDLDETTLAYIVAPERDFYYPLHYMYPGEYDVSLDVDMSHCKFISESFRYMQENKKPTISGLVPYYEDEKFIAFLHPGVLDRDVGENIAMMQIRTAGLLGRLAENKGYKSKKTVFLFDDTHAPKVDFLAVVELGGENPGNSLVCPGGDNSCVVEKMVQARRNETFLTINHEWTEKDVEDLPGRSIHGSFVLPGERTWKIIVVSDSGSFDRSVGFPVSLGVIIFAASVIISAWYYTSTCRTQALQTLEFKATREQARVKFDAAQKMALAERELNDFIAHEIRNPLSAAISAANFISSSVDVKSGDSELFEEKESVKEDISIIQTSLSYVNELLRNMIDMHRITCEDSSKAFKLDMEYLDVKQDLFDPVVAMIYSRSAEFKVEVVCPEHLVVHSDRMRLKQIILNLARNSQKFVTRGFLRLKAELVEGTVHLVVEDSGPGVPESKRGAQLFTRYQESLDNLNQGTGIGLFVCHKLMKLLGGKLYLDESYHSGLFGMPGARFVANLNIPPCSSVDDEHVVAHVVAHDAYTGIALELSPLPPSLSVLFVDDDMVLRKLFARSMTRECPDWRVDQAASGEAALRMVDANDYDLIFIDMYMRSVEKSLLGSETAKAMRAKGVKSIICGLSANEMESVFLASGADTFYLKPFPCSSDEIRQALHKVLLCRED